MVLSELLKLDFIELWEYSRDEWWISVFRIDVQNRDARVYISKCV